jgi:molybdopterin-guanine dinucleotide biosynthesis protein A
VSTAAIVLCGGLSSRMGRAKAWLPWQGRPMLAHVVETVRPLVDEVVVVAAAGQPLPATAARVIEDREPALGPLAGIREGLAQIRAQRAFVCSTDSPYLTPAFVEALLERTGPAALEVDGFVQVLAAVYPKHAFATAGELIDAGRMRPLALLEAVGYERLTPGDVPDTKSVHGFNTPAEYLDAVRQGSPDARARVEIHDIAGVVTATGVPIGTLAEVLCAATGGATLVDRDEIAPGLQISLDGRSIDSDARIPIGPDECVAVRRVG